MPTTEGVPLYDETRVRQCVTKTLGANMWKDVILYSVALKDR